MRPAHTKYYMAATDAEYAACLAMAEAQDVGEIPRDMPLVYADREGRIVGWLGTRLTDDGVVLVTPLVLSAALMTGRIVLLRLLEALERVLPLLGIHDYAFALDARAAVPYQQAVEALCGPPRHHLHGEAWYIRHVAADVLQTTKEC